MIVPLDQAEEDVLNRLFVRYSVPQEDYPGRCLAASDVVEFYDEEQRIYFYRDVDGFVQVRFSPAFAKPMAERPGENG